MLVHIFFKRLRFIPLFLCITFLILLSFGQGNTEPNPPEASYVIIGAFTYHNNAIKLVSMARERSLKAEYAMNTNRNLYYVYVFTSQNVNDAIRELRKVRNLGNFNDAWVYTGTLGSLNKQGKVIAINKNPSFIETAVSNPPLKGQDNTSEFETEVTDNSDHAPLSDDIKIERDSPLNNNVKIDNRNQPEFKKEAGYYYLYLNTINARKYKEVKGKVNIIDPERAKKLDEVKSHELVKLRDPENGTRRIQLISDIFGFKEVQHIIDLDEPVNDSTEAYVDVIGDSIVVDFNLTRFKKGDVLIMYNVYFYIDAAIMKPESIYELNSLLDMLNENENYKVKIHGHTNGNSTGKIIHLDDSDKNYFSMNDDHKESIGSAKKLSLYRAYTIQEWLIEQGIDPKRMEIKGWGGKKMLFDKFDSQAYKNVRVEIEITDD